MDKMLDCPKCKHEIAPGQVMISSLSRDIIIDRRRFFGAPRSREWVRNKVLPFKQERRQRQNEDNKT